MKKILVACAAAIVLPIAAFCGLIATVIADQQAHADTLGGKGCALKGVPAQFHTWICRAAQQCPYPELSPALLAAQLNAESGFSTSRSTISGAGAEGPAQFEPSTWATWGRDTDGKGYSDPFDVGDAVTAQGRMMCSLIGQARTSGLGGDVRALALAGYNAGWGAVEASHGVPHIAETESYVSSILASMKQYEGPDDQLQIAGSGSGPDALRRAAQYLGTPYVWGGGSPQGPTNGYCDGTNGYLNGSCFASGHQGFDCSSLVQYAYWPDVQLPRTAAEQYDATSNHPVAKADLQPGDLLFWSHGGDQSIYHVALYAGNGMMLEAPRTGQSVKVAPLTDMPTSDYYGATRV